MNEVVFKVSEWPWCKTEFGVFPEDEKGYFAVTVRTGAAYIQTYAKRSDMLALADMLRHAVEKVEEVQP
jgi:hypothetical protein